MVVFSANANDAFALQASISQVECFRVRDRGLVVWFCGGGGEAVKAREIEHSKHKVRGRSQQTTNDKRNNLATAFRLRIEKKTEMKKTGWERRKNGLNVV